MRGYSDTPQYALVAEKSVSFLWNFGAKERKGLRNLDCLREIKVKSRERTKICAPTILSSYRVKTDMVNLQSVLQNILQALEDIKNKLDDLESRVQNLELAVNDLYQKRGETPPVPIGESSEEGFTTAY